MNIYSMEIKTQMKNFVIWTVSILLIYIYFMTGMYDMFIDGKDSMEKMMAGFTPAYAAAFGVELDTMFSYGGFFTFTFVYISLMGAIMSVFLSVGIFSREKRFKCVDFLLTKPVSRTRIFLIKLLSVLTLLVAANILFVVTTIIFRTSDAESATLGTAVWAACALFFTQLLFAGFGIVFAIFARRIRSVSGVATAIGFSGFILTTLNNLLAKEGMRFIAPLKYFETGAVFATGGYEPTYVLTASGVFVACLVLAYIKFVKNDMPAA